MVVSNYFPWSQIAPSYWTLDFVSEAHGAGWGSFLKTYTQLTRRAPRGLNGAKRASRVSLRNGLASVSMISNQMSGNLPTNNRMIYMGESNDVREYSPAKAQRRKESALETRQRFAPLRLRGRNQLTLRPPHWPANA